MTIRTDLYGGLPSLLANREHLFDVSDVSDKELAVLEEQAKAAVANGAFIMETAGRMLSHMARLPEHEHDLSYADMARFSDTLLSEIGGVIHGVADILAELSHQIGYREGYRLAVLDVLVEKDEGVEK